MGVCCWRTQAKFRRRTPHEPNRMKMRENKGFCSFCIRFGSCEVRRLNLASITKAKRALCDLAQFVTQHFDHWAKLQNTPPLICISLNKNSIYCYIPRSSKHTDTCNGWVGVFCNRSPQYQRQRNKYLSWQLKTMTWTWKCTRCIMQISSLYASDFAFKNFYKLA